MRVSPLAQRDLNQARVDYLVANFDLDQIGILTVSSRGGVFWIIDGQHRKGALEAMGWGDQQVQCDVYEGLTEADEAEMFLRRNDVLGVTAYSKFVIGVQAGREEEVAISGIVRAAGLKVSNSRALGSVGAVGALRTIYRRDGAEVLARTLRLARDAYGPPGFAAPVLEGLGMLIHRYDRDFRDEYAAEMLRTATGGITALTGQAEVLRRTTDRPRPQCIAAAAVELINRGRGGKKLTPWFKAEALVEV
jgi:hypothetical protein